MQRRKTLLSVVAAVALALGLAACGGDSGASGGSEDIVLGTTLPLTGPLGIFGPPIRAGYEQAVKAVNDAGGVEIDGTKHMLKLVVKDSKSDPTVVTSTTRSLINDDGAVALLGSVTPPLTIPFSVVAEQEQIPAISPLTPTLAWLGANQEGWRYAFDVFVDEKEQTAVNFEASDLVETNKKVALFTDTEEDGKAMGGLWEAQAPEYGYEVVYHAEFPVGTTDFSQFIQEAKSSGAEVMIAQVIPPDAAALFKQMKSLDYQPKTAWPEKGGTVDFPQGAGDAAEGASVFGWWSPTNGNVGGQAVYDANKAEFGDGLGAQSVVAAYSMVQILADALTRAGSTDPDAIREALSQTKDLDTVWAPITIEENNRAVIPPTAVQWQGDSQVTVWPEDQATGSLIAPVPGLGG
jgi:branched-chain amino acid transport system substrate-binding protein